MSVKVSAHCQYVTGLFTGIVYSHSSVMFLILHTGLYSLGMCFLQIGTLLSYRLYLWNDANPELPVPYRNLLLMAISRVTHPTAGHQGNG